MESEITAQWSCSTEELRRIATNKTFCTGSARFSLSVFGKHRAEPSESGRKGSIESVTIGHSNSSDSAKLDGGPTANQRWMADLCWSGRGLAGNLDYWPQMDGVFS